MEQRSPQLKYALISFTFFVITCLMFWYLNSLVRSNQATAEELESSWQMESSRRYDINSLARTIGSVSSEVSSLETHYVHTYNVVSFLNEIERMGARVSVKAEIVSVDDIEDEDGNALIVGVRATGTFASLYKFLTLLENSQYEMEVTSLDMKRTEQDINNRNPLWGANIRVKLLTFIP